MTGLPPIQTFTKKHCKKVPVVPLPFFTEHHSNHERRQRTIRVHLQMQRKGRRGRETASLSKCCGSQNLAQYANHIKMNREGLTIGTRSSKLNPISVQSMSEQILERDLKQFAWMGNMEDDGKKERWYYRFHTTCPLLYFDRGSAPLMSHYHEMSLYHEVHTTSHNAIKQPSNSILPQQLKQLALHQENVNWESGRQG